MSKQSLLFTLAAIAVSVSMWGADWPMPGGSPQRNGWAKSEHLIDKNNVRALKLLYKYQTDNLSRGLHSLSPPIVNGNLITYRGFKEMLIFSGSADRVYSLDADLNSLLWDRHLPYLANKPAKDVATATCPGGLTSPVVMAGSSSASMHFSSLASRAPAAAGVPPPRPSPYFPPLAQSVYPLRPTTLTQLNALYVASSDGYLHVLNSSTGEDLVAAVRFVPPNAKVTSLNIRDNVVYATTGGNCDGYQNALFAIDLLSPEKTVTSFVPPAGGFAGETVTAVGNDGTIYVQTAYSPGDPGTRNHDTVVALEPKNLKVKDYFTTGGKALARRAVDTPGIGPIVFSYAGRDMVVAGGRNGRLYLLDSRSLGGPDHHTPVFESAPIATASKNYDGNGFRGAFSSWLDVETGRRWFYAPVSGSPKSLSKDWKASKSSDSGYLLAFQLGGTDAAPRLETAWTSHKIQSPAPAVIANGMLFVLATGEYPRLVKNGRPYEIAELQKLTKPATLYVLDASSGTELYTSGEAISRGSPSAELAVANGRVYFTAPDNAVYCFGISDQQRQLVEQ